MNNLTTQELIDKHNELVKNNELSNIYDYRMEINRKTGSMSWENSYKYLDLNYQPLKEKPILNNKKEIINSASMETKEILKNCTISGHIVKLPNTTLSRNEYLDVKKSLELIGGKWKGGKTYGFVFNEDPTELLKQIASGEKRNLKKEFQFFETPPTLADKMVSLANVSTEHLILEPSAGQGAIVKAINKVLPDKIVLCVELMEINRTILEKLPTANVCDNDFLNIQSAVLLRTKFDRIIANPPFSNNSDIKHIYQMYKYLKVGGRLVTVASKHWQISENKTETEFKNWIKKVNAKVKDIPAGTFKDSGTLISACLIIIDK